MKIELKNIKLNLAFSEETIMFKADVYANGNKIAYASNDGRGGETYYNSYGLDTGEILKQAEEYCKQLPPKNYNYSDKSISIDQNLTNVIDDLLYEYSNNRESEKAQKKLKKDMEKGIVYGNKDNYSVISWGKLKILDVLNHPTGKKLITDKIQELLLSGENILNTNLPYEIFKPETAKA